jgi:hypothetical protein
VVALHDDGSPAPGLHLLAGGVRALRVLQVVHGDIGALAANSIAVACPIPESDPVMSATLSWSFPMRSSLLVRWWFPVVVVGLLLSGR